MGLWHTARLLLVIRFGCWSGTMASTVVYWGSATSHSELQLSIQHSKPKAGDWLAEVKLYKLSTATGAGLSSVQFCTSVRVCLCCGQRQAQEITPPLPHSVVSLILILVLIDAGRLLVSCPSFLPQPLPSTLISPSCSLFHSSFSSLLLCLATKPLTEAWRQAKPQPAVATDWLTM